MIVASCVWGAIVLDGSGLSCTSHYILTISLQCVLVQIGPYYGCIWKDFFRYPIPDWEGVQPQDFKVYNICNDKLVEIF